MIKILMLGGTGAIGQSILKRRGNNSNYQIYITTRIERQSTINNVHYICGNANDISFINTFKDNSFDVLIDFMNYRNEILEQNFSKLIRIARQYVFLSSARVYDNSKEVIDENCSLLWHTTSNMKLKNSGTYSVKKAYQELFVKKNGGDKVTIIRPYKTYSSSRLQLGQYEIRHWLERIINGFPIVINENILDKYTALTDGIDVAEGMISLIGNKNAFGEIYQIVTSEVMTWREILQLYIDVLKRYSFSPVIYLSNETEEIDRLFESGFQMPYDILFDRKFSSSKILQIKPIKFKPMREGLEKALSDYMENYKELSYVKNEYDKVVDSFIKSNTLKILEDKKC